MVINNNMMSLFASRQEGINTSNLQKTMEKLSSGEKINKVIHLLGKNRVFAGNQIEVTVRFNSINIEGDQVIFAYIIQDGNFRNDRNH